MSYNPQAAEEVHLIYDVVRLSFSYLPLGE
jgi:hypothetical protein